jgi:hypothetical protein
LDEIIEAGAFIWGLVQAVIIGTGDVGTPTGYVGTLTGDVGTPRRNECAI